MESDNRRHTIVLNNEAYIQIKIPDIIKLDELKEIVHKLEETAKIFKVEETAKQVLKENVTQPLKSSKHKEAVEEYINAPHGQKKLVAEKYGINLFTLKSYVRKYEKKAGVRHSGKRKYDIETVKKCVDMIKKGIPTGEVAEEMGFSSSKHMLDIIRNRLKLKLSDIVPTQ